MSLSHFVGKELKYLFSHAKGRQGCTSSNLWSIQKNQKSHALKMSLYLIVHSSIAWTFPELSNDIWHAYVPSQSLKRPQAGAIDCSTDFLLARRCERTGIAGSGVGQMCDARTTRQDQDIEIFSITTSAPSGRTRSPILTLSEISILVIISVLEKVFWFCKKLFNTTGHLKHVYACVLTKGIEDFGLNSRQSDHVMFLFSRPSCQIELKLSDFQTVWMSKN